MLDRTASDQCTSSSQHEECLVLTMHDIDHYYQRRFGLIHTVGS
jgi:hypothetical protein